MLDGNKTLLGCFCRHLLSLGDKLNMLNDQASGTNN